MLSMAAETPLHPAPDSRRVNSQPLRPYSFAGLSSAFLLDPTGDVVGPSPVTSVGTETTEIEDDLGEKNAEGHRIRSHPSFLILRTNVPDYVREPGSDEVVSAIHAPQSFRGWQSHGTFKSDISRSITASSVASSTISPSTSESSTAVKRCPDQSPPTVDTNIRPSKYCLDTTTPQAQALSEVIDRDRSRPRTSSINSHTVMPKTPAFEDYSPKDFPGLDSGDNTAIVGDGSEVSALRTALEECWTLCNTLANLSTNHRLKMFSMSGTPGAHEKAWKTCWKLCKRLYSSRYDDSESHSTRDNLDLCRDFCQALFDVRQKKDEMSDSVLRVSFELNNHLYSAHDSRNLPEAFRERTLDFYIALCHRLMKQQRIDLAEETDSLLRACWTLAEILFNLRQNRRHGYAPDDYLLGSAIQACWELCDMFREGWAQIRPDRATLNYSRVGVFPSKPTTAEADVRSNSGSRSSLHSKHDSTRSSMTATEAETSLLPPQQQTDRPKAKPPPRPIVPETPVTEFEDTLISPESASPQAPDIVVLEASSDARGERAGAGPRWSSSASSMSSYSRGSAHTSSTVTTTTLTAGGEDGHFARVRIMLLRVATDLGFPADPGPDATQLQAFVKNLPERSFGTMPGQMTLFQNYKNMVATDAAFARIDLSGGRKLDAADVGKSVEWIVRKEGGQYGFLRELFLLVFGFTVEEAEGRRGVSLAMCDSYDACLGCDRMAY